MNKLDKNFHINMSPLYLTFVFMIFMLWASEVKGDEIEEIIVTAQQEKTVKDDVSKLENLFSKLNTSSSIKKRKSKKTKGSKKSRRQERESRASATPRRASQRRCRR